MKVKDLIKTLKEYNKDMVVQVTVFFPASCGNCNDSESASDIRIKKYKVAKGVEWVQLGVEINPWSNI